MGGVEAVVDPATPLSLLQVGRGGPARCGAVHALFPTPPLWGAAQLGRLGGETTTTVG